MKKLILLVLGVFFLLTSCSDNDNDDHGFPITFEEMNKDYDYFISVEEMFEVRNVIEVVWTAYIEPVDYELSLGGFEIMDIEWVAGDNQGNGREEVEWYSIIHIEKDLIEIIYQSIQFVVAFNGKNHQGELILNPEISCESVIQFQFDEDIVISWAALDEPQLYNLNLYHYWIGDLGYESDQFNYQLSGSATSYTLEYSLYSGHSNGDYESLLAFIYAVNYYRENRFLIYSVTNKIVTYDNMVGK